MSSFSARSHVDIDFPGNEKGFFVGTWTLTGTTVMLNNLVDPSGRVDRYGFEMILHLKSKPLGRYVQIIIISSLQRVEPFDLDGTS